MTKIKKLKRLSSLFLCFVAFYGCSELKDPEVDLALISKQALGQRLFFDTLLSNHRVSHVPAVITQP
ncbi:MAG: hypothetical protein ACI9PZ_000703 [Parvicella sp.]|jgi:hypothetical protein